MQRSGVPLTLRLLRRRTWQILTVLLVGASSQGAAPSDPRAAYDIRQVDLSLRVDPAKRSVSGSASIQIRVVKPVDGFLLDLDARMKVREARVTSGPGSGQASGTAWDHQGSQLRVSAPRKLAVGTLATVGISYEGSPKVAPNPPWDGGITWATNRTGLPWVATSVQMEGGSVWWPCKDDPADKIESMSLRIRVPKPLVVASNGRLIATREHDDDTRTFHWSTGLPISSYNVALNIAPYETLHTNYTSVTGEIVPVAFWVLPERRARAEKFLPEVLEHLSFYERYLGPYPFRAEKYGVAETPYLGMEHQTIIAYGNGFRGGPNGFDWLHHHELGHEWWGNLVTARDWSHFWIHEGLCTYMQALYTEERDGEAAYHRALQQRRPRLDNAHPLVPAGPVSLREMSNTAGDDAYSKGAWVVHMLRYLIGRERTLQVLRRFAYPTAPTPGQAPQPRLVTTRDFVRLASSVCGQDLDWFFRFYLEQPRLPRLVSHVNGPDLHLKWETPKGYAFPMPLELEVEGRTERVRMSKGQARLDATRYRDAKFDPQGWILKD